MATKKLYQTAALVTALSIVERFLGFLYRIVLSRTIQETGMGLYQIALSLFAVLVTVTSSGIPITLSRMITKHRAENNLRGERSSVTAGILLSLAFSVPVFLFFMFFHDSLSFLFSDKNAESLFLIMLFGLVFNSVYAVLRGSFWGNKQFLAYSLIELVEEAVMITVGTVLVLRATDVLSGAKRAALAVVVSYVCSFAIALIYFFVKGGRLSSPRREFRPLFSSSMPITAMRTSTSLINSLVAVLLPARLMSCGMTSERALAEFGVAFGMAIPVLFIPSTLIGSFSLVLVPELSENFYKQRHGALKKDIENALTLTIAIACLMIPFLFVLGKDAGFLLYGSEKAGEMISYSCLMLLPMSVSMITTSMLNSLQLEKRTLLNYLLGAAALLLCLWFLPQAIGVYALIVGMCANFTLSCALDLILLHKKCVQKPKYLAFLFKACLFSLFMSLSGTLYYDLSLKLFSYPFALAATLLSMGLTALLLSLLLDLIPRSQLKKLFKKKQFTY